jgi:hypothetical protein
MTKRSTNVIKEYRNFLWLTDKNGKVLNQPEPGWDHAMDAIRYALTSMQRKERTDEKAVEEAAEAYAAFEPKSFEQEYGAELESSLSFINS